MIGEYPDRFQDQLYRAQCGNRLRLDQEFNQSIKIGQCALGVNYLRQDLALGLEGDLPRTRARK